MQLNEFAKAWRENRALERFSANREKAQEIGFRKRFAQAKKEVAAREAAHAKKITARTKQALATRKLKQQKAGVLGKVGKFAGKHKKAIGVAAGVTAAAAGVGYAAKKLRQRRQSNTER